MRNANCPLCCPLNCEGLPSYNLKEVLEKELGLMKAYLMVQCHEYNSLLGLSQFQ